MKKGGRKKIGVLMALVAGACLAFTFIVLGPALADDSISDISKKVSEKQKKIKELEKQAEAYLKIIELKEKQQLSLDNQIGIMDAEIQKVEIEIQINKGKIEELNSQIHDLELKITEQEKLIGVQKKVLTELVRAYYENSQQNVLSALFESNEFSRFIIKEDQIIQIGDKVKDIMDTLKSLKDNLVNEKKSKEEKKTELTELYFTLEEKNSELQNNKEKKELLIAQTEGEENKFRSLLDKVEAQKQELLGDIDQLYGANSSEINSLIAKLEKPTSGLASTSWYYSQKDKRWGNNRIGQSDSLVKDYGCALTSVAMVFTYHGENTTPGNLAKQKIYFWDLIAWPSGKNVKLIKNSGHGGLKWAEVDRALDKGNPVIVYIKASSKGGHYVVIHHKAKNGRYVVHDPYWGSNIYLDSSMKLLAALYKVSISKSNVDQMILYED